MWKSQRKPRIRFAQLLFENDPAASACIMERSGLHASLGRGRTDAARGPNDNLAAFSQCVLECPCDRGYQRRKDLFDAFRDSTNAKVLWESEEAPSLKSTRAMVAPTDSFGPVIRLSQANFGAVTEKNLAATERSYAQDAKDDAASMKELDIYHFLQGFCAEAVEVRGEP